MAPVPTFSNPDQASNFTSGLTAVLACAIPLLAFVYAAAVFWTLDRASRRRVCIGKSVPLFKSRGHLYAIFGYAFSLVISLIMIAIPTWLLLQYSLQHNYPNVQTRTAMRLLLFAAVWTFLTAFTFTLLSIHPSWSRLPISSLGSQLLWVVLTWIFWVVGAVLLNSADPQLFNMSVCESLTYCHHIRAVFILSIIEMATFSGGMILMVWLVWRLARDVWFPAPSANFVHTDFAPAPAPSSS